ncbi:MAG: rhodanese-like domain-containing protein [Armatimonadetes bacterium]|nr:rhodanese-like domain-containing protein [Armatimonadota bacterium]
MSIEAPIKDAVATTSAMSAIALRQRLDSGDAVVVDVRTTGEFASGHIARSINVPMDEIEARLEDIPTGGKVVLVCQSGMRSKMTFDRLRGRLDKVVCLDGGIDSWTKSGQPVVQSVRSSIALDRQAMIGASVIILMSVGLGAFVSPGWFYLALVPGVGLMMAGAFKFCLMGTVLSKMPWNKSS